MAVEKRVQQKKKKKRKENDCLNTLKVGWIQTNSLDLQN